MRAIGLMSGTSLDGVDAVLVDLVPRGHGYAIAERRFVSGPFAPDFRERLLAAMPPHQPSPSDVAALDTALGEAFAGAAMRVAEMESVDFIACHGLTLFHRGEASQTLQIGSPYRLRDALGASVVFDFRRADCAAGGSGAPLVPFVDAVLFASDESDVVALNIGGIANVTVLERGAPAERTIAWDTGPGNMLLDAFVARRTGNAETFDCDGAHAAKGVVDENALANLIAREAFFLMLPPPKSTGRERFGSMLLDAHAELFEGMSIEDGCATLAAYTAATICDSLDAYGPASARVIASGGGTHNLTLMAMLRERLERTGSTLVTSDSCGIASDSKEAIAFAVLAYETLRGRPSSLPGATGAARPAVLGAIAPFGLAELLAKITAECLANGTS